MKIPFKKHSKTFGLVVMVSTALTACGSGSDSTNQTDSTVNTSSDSTVAVVDDGASSPVVTDPIVTDPVVTSGDSGSDTSEPVVSTPVDVVPDAPVNTVLGGAVINGDEAFVTNADDPFNRLLENVTDVPVAGSAPTTPRNLRVDLIGNDWVEFNWSPSVDDVDVVAYNIYRDNAVEPTYVLERGMTHPNAGVVAELNKFWETTSFIDCNRTRFLDRVYFCNGGPNGEPARGPEIGASHTYQVTAVDNEGNESARSNQISVQLFEKTGSPLPRYFDPHFAVGDSFPFDSDLSTPANYTDRFELVFSEDFNQQSLDPAKWNTRLTWGPDTTINSEQQYFVDTMNNPEFGYDPFKFNGSTLTIEAVKTPPELIEAANGQRYLSGALSTYDKFGMTYGYVESKMKVSGVYGALSSFYLYHRWAAEHAPEIDIVEYLGYNQFGDEDAFQTYHYRDSQFDNNGITHSSPTMANKNESGALYSEAFHTFGVLWEPGLIVWYIDGVEIKRLSGPQVSRQQMNIVAYLVTGSGWTQAPDEYNPADDLVEMQDSVVNLPFKLESENPLTLEIDYIRVWQRPEFIQ